MKRTPLYTMLLSFLATSALADVRMPILFSANMVLQHDKVIKVWGWANPSKKVNVALSGKTVATKVDARGEWRVELSLPVPDRSKQARPAESSGPANITASWRSKRNFNPPHASKIHLPSAHNTLYSSIFNTCDSSIPLN